jgi:bifunctional non-homologous end joining protein LigD
MGERGRKLTRTSSRSADRARQRPPTAAILFSKAIEAEGAVVFAHARKFGLEGIVSKRLGSRYRSGPSRNWLKVLNPEFQRR